MPLAIIILLSVLGYISCGALFAALTLELVDDDTTEIVLAIIWPISSVLLLMKLIYKIPIWIYRWIANIDEDKANETAKKVFKTLF